ncbi:MAG: FG-GAP repeat protein, partial [Thermoplasmata archaeon]|nr:FG-GAP repeat protein [Thermoplasmata archaeon]
MILILVGMAPILGSFSVVDEVQAEEESSGEAFGNVRSGFYDMSEYGYEFSIEGAGQRDWFGSNMVTMDWNGDGVEDFVVAGAYMDYTRGGGPIKIFDGTKSLMPPDLNIQSSEADWSIMHTDSGQYKMWGGDLDVGDVNGDGYDDLLTSMNVYYYYGSGAAYLFYGGPHRDADRGNMNQNDANVSFAGSNTNFGKSVGLGDIDGDGYDDVFVSAPYYRYSYSGYKYGMVFGWWGGSLKSSYSWLEYDLRVIPRSSIYYNNGYYAYFGSGPIVLGDMDGDGREELVISSSYGWLTSEEGGYTYAGTVTVFHPKSNIGSVSNLIDIESSYADCTVYYGDRSANYQQFGLGLNTKLGDLNGDGLDDLAMSTWRGNGNKGSAYVVMGSATYNTGNRAIMKSSNYDHYFEPQSSSNYFGSLAIGDWDGDGQDDLAIGAPYGSNSMIWIFGENYFKGGGQKDLDLDDEVFAVTLITIKGPTITGNNMQAAGGMPYYYYPTWSTLCFWNRDDIDGAEDLFIGNPYNYKGTSYYHGKVWGLSNYDMVGKPQVRQLNGELPDYKTFYIGRSSYDFKASVMNRWDPMLSFLDMTMTMGDYEVDISLSADGNWSVDGDDLGWLDVDSDSFNVQIDYINSEAIWTWTMGFTMNATYDGYIDLLVDNGMRESSIEEFAYLRSKFRYTGELEAWVGGDPPTRFYDGEEHRSLLEGETVPENTDLVFTGIGIIYDGTENFMNDFGVEPFYPKQEYFSFEAENIHGQTVKDESSMGRDFVLPLNTGSMPIKVTFDFMLRDLPGSMVVNDLPGFHVYVDNDVPMAPSGLMIHADSFTDTNVLVDNDGELFVTWYEPAEIFSGVRYYEVMATGVEGTIFTKNTFLQIDTEAEGEVEVSIRAYDMVDHVGEYASVSIYLDYEGLEYSDYFPGPTEWFNTLNPEVGVTITDIGGLSIPGSSVEYMISSDGGETYGSWLSTVNELSAQTVTIEIAPTLTEGADNFVIFRAKDAAGNQMESEPVQVSVDLSEVHFSDILVNDLEEWDGIWFDTGDVSLSMDILDTHSGVDQATVEYRLSTRGRANLNSENWEVVETTVSGGNTSLDMDLDLIYGDVNFIQFKAKDLVGNPTSYSEVFNIWVNTQPVAVIDAPVNGLNVMEGSIIALDAGSSYDVDGDMIEVFWNDTWTDEEGTEMVIELGADAIDPFKFDVILLPGTHLITLSISDGLHEITTEPVEVTVTAIEEAIWLYSTLDTDGDGMVNSYEYLYHLGWNDDSNGGLDLNENNDFDGDGHTDLEEYNWGSNPTDTTDFPLPDVSNIGPDDPNMTLYIVLIVLACLVFLILIAMIMFNSVAIKKKLADQEVKDADVEKQDIENALSSGGREKLLALKAVSEGRRVASLPSAAAAVSAYQSLPTAEGAVDQVDQGAVPTPEPIQPAPMQAAEPAPA